MAVAVVAVVAEVAVAVAPSRNRYYYYSKTTINAMGSGWSLKIGRTVEIIK